ncbi:hypothetical protein [Nocardioides speluncae]|uniref:hypothetical protein n=1 Tax=Nocardioides speluncae TaxID=2670337 RepID=UPI000D6884D5|nr:hypothetical protein [Nocardioides speluncae]
MPDLTEPHWNGDQLVAESLARRLDGLEPPAGNLAAVTRQGSRLRRRRASFVATAGLAAVACGAVIAGQAMIGGPGGSAEAYAPLGALDLSKGLRAYSVGDGKVHLAGRTFDEGDVRYLDTSARAVPAGVVFFDSKLRPHLLDASGNVSRLGDGSTAGLDDFYPTTVADVTSSVVGWTVRHDDRIQIVLYDVDAREQVGTRDVPCAGDACDDVRLDGLDDGIAFVRTPDGMFTWDTGDDSWTKIAGPETRIADVHNGVVLHDGPAPTHTGPVADWRFVSGAIDAQLTFDGKYVLNWSSTLKATTPGAPDLKLDVPVDDLGFYTIDTDGSVLVAMMGGDGSTEARPADPGTLPELGTEPGAEVTLKVPLSDMASPGEELPSDSTYKDTFFDCEVPSGECEKLGEHEVNGDPMFVGNDM